MKRLLTIVVILLSVVSKVTAAPTVKAIDGTFGVCKGSVTHIHDSTAGGHWASSDSSIAIVDTGGYVIGLSAGTIAVSYTVGTTTVTALFTVWPLPVLTPDTLRGCVGSTYYINPIPTGGGWTSSVPSVASVNFVGEVVGLAAGSTVISYTSAAGCKSGVPVTINPLPLPITGTNYVYSTYTTTLADLTPGGTWTSSAPSLASVNATTGVVTGVSSGLAIISYGIPPAGCAATRRVEVNPLPGALNLTAWYPFCGDTTDKSPAGRDLLNYTGTPALDTIDRFGNSRNAYYFFGGNCRMQYTTFFPNSGTPNDYTYSVWINPSVAQSSIILYNGNPNTDGFGFVMNDGTGFPGGVGSNVAVYFAGFGQFLSTPVTLNTWHNLVLVKSGNSYRFYIDNVSQGFFISAFNPMSTGSFFALGGNASGVPLPDLGYVGYIDDAAILQKQLSNAERLSLYYFNPDSRKFTLGADTTVCSDNMILRPSPQTPGAEYRWKTYVIGSGYVLTDTLDTSIVVYPNAGPFGNFYSLTVSKPFGCTVSDTITVYKSPIPVSLGADKYICKGESISLSPSVSFPGSSYIWSTGDTTHTISVGTTGNYFLTVDSVIHFLNSSGLPDSSVCVGRDTVYVHTADVPEITVPSSVTDCRGNPVTVHTITNPGYQYFWSTGSTDTFLAVAATGIYWLRVTDTGCVRTDTFTAVIVDESVTLLSPDTAICQGDRVAARSTVNTLVSYQWTPTAGVPVSTLPSVFITPDSSAEYYLTVRYPGCPDLVDSFFIDVQPRPIVSLGGNRDVCEGDTIHITAKSSPAWYLHNQYAWTPANPNINVADSSTIIFTALTRHDSEEIYVKVYAPVYLTGAPQCYSIDSAAIFVHPKFKDTMNAIYKFCPGDTLVFHPDIDSLANALGVIVSSVRWSPGTYLSDSTVSNPVIRPITSQTYRLISSSQFGCKDTLYTSVVVHPAAVIELGDSVIITPGQSYQINPQTNCVNFLWYPPLGLDYERIANPVATPAVSTRYIITASTEDGCVATDSIKIHVDPGMAISIPNAFSPDATLNNTFKIIKNGLVGLNYFRIFDRWGNKMFETHNIDEGWDGKFNGKPQPIAVYVYDVEAVTTTGATFHRQGNVTLIR